MFIVILNNFDMTVHVGVFNTFDDAETAAKNDGGAYTIEYIPIGEIVSIDI
jgi:hypothetical protein